MFFLICQTEEEKKLVRKYWEEVRIKTGKIRDAYDRVNDNKFHNTFYETHKRNKGVRPDFMEPLPKKIVMKK